MGSISKLFILTVAVIVLAISSQTEARPLHPNSSLVARLRLDISSSSKCWDSLLQLQSCSGEVVMFFLYGETSLGHKCCEAIKIIRHDCWPSLLGSLGLTPEEGDVLENYCDSADRSGPSPLPPPPLGQNIKFSMLEN